MINQIRFSIALLLLAQISFAQTWESVVEPPGFRTDHTFGFAIDGKGYLVAGTTEFDGHSNRFMQFDPAAEEWTELDAFPGDARGYGIGDVWGNKAYFGFGTSEVALLNDLWVFNEDSMKWTQLSTCPCEPRLHPAMIAFENKVFVGLGNNNNGNLNDWWEYDVLTNQWTQKPDFPDTRRHHPFQFKVGEMAYVGFGHGAGIFKDLFQYDPAEEIWTKLSDLPGEGRVAGTQFSYDNKGYVLSGDGEDHLSMEEGEFWSYDPDSDTWNQLPSHPGKSRWAPASFILDGIVYMFNGTTFFEGTGYVYQEEAYQFDLEALISSSDKISNDATFDFHPNPADAEIMITWPSNASSRSWKLMDVFGHVVSANNERSLGDSETINVTHLPPGIYFLSSNQMSKRIIIQH